jgi:hypothetical protein
MATANTTPPSAAMPPAPVLPAEPFEELPAAPVRSA